ncbi:urease accessory protein [Acetobacter aceti NBRC 14818]|uniref:Urease accessory protein UreF n=2 Tax=Acetobacter aceti TaxID=435 RepID=A0AB33IAS8_ACEAC|nr:urease accessory protein [Acetobacter aceti NBRC 14818]BCK75231.1 urease accessory protein UreF [Acetobacter aceti NBRC 14818]GAN57479.1 urease accessory protein UreF [Acetobacter aceti NBRC 14818]
MDALQLTRLLSWLSPAFPTGGFAYSHGLEWAIECGDVTDVPSLVEWIGSLLAHGSLHTDMILLRAAWRADTLDEMRVVAQEGCALASSRERFEETVKQGNAFLRAVKIWDCLPPAVTTLTAQWPLPVMYGVALKAAGFDEDVAALGCAHVAVSALVSAAVRLIPLGQTDGLRALAALEKRMAAAVATTKSLTLEDAGGLCFRSDLAAMHHETQETRLFRT